MTNREIFYKNIAQTSQFPMALEVKKAEGVYITDKNDKKYIDLIAGISVSNLGHKHPAIINAIKKQIDTFSYVMVYGEFIQPPQTEYAKLICKYLPETLNSVYFVNSGSEAVEGSLKLAKRYTDRTEIIAFKNAYHGSTHGSLSVTGVESLKNAFRPLLPDIKHISLNNIEDLDNITNRTAAVIIEAIQGEAGVQIPQKHFMQKLREKCNQTDTVLIIDEIQTAFARTGTLFGFEHYNIVPDIITLAKSFGGGMPLGAFIASNKIMQSLTHNPILGHISTFGGHPVCCAAGKAALQTIINQNLTKTISHKENLFLEKLKHPAIKNIRSKGLLMAIEFEAFDFNKKVIDACLSNGLITDWFLFDDKSLRLAPPLIINEKEINYACKILLKTIESVAKI